MRLRLAQRARNLAALGSCSLALVIAALPTSADVFHEEGDFAFVDTTSFLFNGGNPIGGITTGGNPGDAWYQNQSLGSPPMGEISAVLTFLLVDAATFEFDPMASGGFDAIDFEIDVEAVGAAAQNYSLALRQDGVYYFAEIGSGGLWDIVDSTSGWETRSFPGLLASDFSRMETSLPGRNFTDIAQLVNANAQPDFSPTASPIEIGLLFLNAGTGGGGDAAYDNLRVEFVPEPQPIHAGWVGAIAVASLRGTAGPRRRSAQRVGSVSR